MHEFLILSAITLLFTTVCYAIVTMVGASIDFVLDMVL